LPCDTPEPGWVDLNESVIRADARKRKMHSEVVFIVELEAMAGEHDVRRTM